MLDSGVLEIKTVYPLYTAPYYPKHFIVIGAGGTGGYLIPNLARLISIMNKNRRSPHLLTIIDGDLIEPKNLTRQNFYECDIGKNKAQVMAERASESFGIDVTYIDKYLTGPNVLASYARPQGDYIPVFIGCVDNNRTRMIIYEAFKHTNYCFYIDAGKALLA